MRRRGLAIGIAFSGVGVGSILMPPWIQTVIVRSGWRTACYATAALVLLTLLPLNLLQRRHPQDLGLAPDVDAEPPADTGRGHPANVVDPAWAIEWTLARAVRTARFWWIVVGFIGGLFAWYAVQVYQTKYLIEIGFAPTLAVALLDTRTGSSNGAAQDPSGVARPSTPQLRRFPATVADHGVRARTARAPLSSLQPLRYRGAASTAIARAVPGGRSGGPGAGVGCRERRFRQRGLYAAYAQRYAELDRLASRPVILDRVVRNRVAGPAR